MNKTMTIMVNDRGTVLVDGSYGVVGKTHASYEDGATVARLLADVASDNNVNVNLIYNW